MSNFMTEPIKVSPEKALFSHISVQNVPCRSLAVLGEDIGVNLTDGMYQGMYNGSKKHDADIGGVLKRSWEGGLVKMIITGGSLEESRRAIDLAKSDDKLYATVGCHPTRCVEFENSGCTPEEYLASLGSLVTANRDKVVAFGECGLDYDRLQFCPKETQKKYLQLQLTLNESLDLPLFLHCRNAAADLLSLLAPYRFKGVVHSFDGTVEEARQFIDLGYFIGLNGCSLKTPDNLETVKQLPIEKVLMETDSPWCEIRPTHAGYRFLQEESKAIPAVKKEKFREGHLVKGRNEPVNIRQVLDVIAGVKGEPADVICERIFQTTNKLFFD